MSNFEFLGEPCRIPFDAAGCGDESLVVLGLLYLRAVLCLGRGRNLVATPPHMSGGYSSSKRIFMAFFVNV